MFTRTPYDQRSATGYSVTLCIELASGCGIGATMLFSNTFYIGIAYFIITILDDIIASFKILNGTQNAEEYQLIIKKAIVFHNTVLRLLM